MNDWFVSEAQGHETIYRIDAIQDALSCIHANYTQIRLDVVKRLKNIPAVTKQNFNTGTEMDKNDGLTEKRTIGN